MPIKDQNNLTIVRAAAGKLIPENFVEIAAPIDLSPESIISISAPNDLSAESAGSVAVPNTIPSESAGSVAVPVDLSTQAAGQVSAPNDITPVPPLRVGGAAILCGVDFEGVGVTETGGVVTNPEFGLNFNTFERLTIPSNVSGFPIIQLSFDQSFTADTIAISIHNIGSTGGQIGDVSTNGPSGFVVWNDENFTVSEKDHTIIIKISDPVELNQLTIAVGKSSGYEVFVGNIMVGERVEMPPIYGGHLPATLNRTTQYESNVTRTGNWVGRSVKKRGYSTSFSFQHIDPLFARNVIAPLLDCMERSPFVVQWRPDKYPSEVIYCWTNDDPQLSNMGSGHDLMQMSFSVEAYRGL